LNGFAHLVLATLKVGSPIGVVLSREIGQGVIQALLTFWPLARIELLESMEEVMI
jgi:hypothetical protein